MAKGVPITQEKIKARKRKRMFWFLFLILSAAVLIFCGLSFVSSLQIFQVKHIEVSGAEGETAAAAQRAAAANILGSVLWFFPRSNIFIVSARSVANDIVESSPNISKATVSKKFFDTLDINIEEKSPSALWCFLGNCDILDSSGVAFEATTTSSSLIIFDNGEIPAVGASILPSDEFASLSAFIEYLPSRGLYPSSVKINQSGETSVIVGTSTALIVDPSKDLSQSLTNLDLLLTNKTSGMTANQINSLQYLDLRFSDKFFYK